MLRKIRLTFAMICFALITLLFLDFTGTLHGWFGWVNTQFRAYPFYKASEWVPHKKLLLNSIVF